MEIIMKKITGLLIILVSIAAASCGFGTDSQIKEVWHDENFKGKFKRIMIIGVTSNFKLRERFEHECKKHLEAAGVEAIASFDRYDDIKSLKLEVIKDEVSSLHADAVLVTSLIDYKKREKVVGQQTYGMPYNQPFVDYYYVAYYQAATRNDGAFIEDKIVHLETKLFDVKSGKPVVSAVSKTRSQEANIDALTSFSKFLVDKMIKANLLDRQKSNY
jgi:hypothetical protein